MQSYLDAKPDKYSINDTELDSLVEKTDRFSGADLNELFSSAFDRRRSELLDEAYADGGPAAGQKLSMSDVVVNIDVMLKAVVSCPANITEQERLGYDSTAHLYLKM